MKPYDNILEFAEGMSKELLGIEQVKTVDKSEDKINDDISQRIFEEEEIWKATINRETTKKDKAVSEIQIDENLLEQITNKKAR